MSQLDRTLAICDLLLGAAHADNHFDAREREIVGELLADLHGDEDLPSEVEERLNSFDPQEFAVDDAASLFTDDSLESRRRLLHLVAAVHEADEELDLAEDDYLRALAIALSLPAEELSALTIDVEVEELESSFAAVRAVPPPVPGKAAGAVDIDLDD